MKKLILIAGLLLIASNGWAEDDDLPPDGALISYHSNGQVRLTGEVKDRKKSGVWGYYYDNGQLEQKETYRNGKPIGTWKSFDREGKLIAEHWYGNGIKDFDTQEQQNYVGSGSVKVKNPNKQ